MAKQRVDIVVAAKDQASRKLGGIAKAAIGMGAAFLTWRGIKSIVAGSVAAYNTQIEAETKLKQAIKATGGAAGFTFGQLKQYAAQLQAVTEYGDEATIEMMSMLATFRNVQGPAFTEATGLILDMSKALNQDLKSSAIMVGKALNDPAVGLSAMSKSGITFSEQQKEQVKGFLKVNDLASAQRIILDELANQFGGQAAAAAGTFGGKMKQLAADFGDAREQMGGMIANIPGFVNGIEWLRTVFRNFGLTMDIVWTSAALGMVGFSENLKYYFGENIKGTLTLTFGVFKNWFSNLFNLWKTWVGNVKDLFTQGFLSIFESIAVLFREFWRGIQRPSDGFNFKRVLETWKSEAKKTAKELNFLEGFELQWEKLPEIAKRPLSEVEKILEDRLGDLGAQFFQKFQEVANPTLTAPIPGTPGSGGPLDLAAAAKASGKVAAVESRFLSGSTRAVDYQKENVGISKRQLTVLERIAANIKNLDGQGNNAVKGKLNLIVSNLT